MNSIHPLINKLATFLKAETYCALGRHEFFDLIGLALPRKTLIGKQAAQEFKAAAKSFEIIDDEAIDLRAFFQSGRAWDMIHIGGGLNFDQILGAVESSLARAAKSAIWIIENTAPDPADRHDNAAFKAVMALHDNHPELSYCSLMVSGDQGRPNSPSTATICWPAPPHPDRRPAFSSLEEIKKMPFWNCLRHCAKLLPMGEGALFHLVGHGLNPDLNVPWSEKETWENLFADFQGRSSQKTFRAQIEEEINLAMEGYKRELEALKEQLAGLISRSRPERR